MDYSQVDISKVKFASLYWENIDKNLLEIQKDIFTFFDIKIDQQLHNNMPHGDWANNLLSQLNDDNILVLVDIDCVPLNKDIIQRAITVADNGGIFGCAQTSNLLDKNFIYAGPMFLAIKIKTWKALGSPTLKEKDKFDVGGYLSYKAIANNIPIHLIYPTVSAINKWKLSNKGTFGTFTVYGESILHVFESRHSILNNTLMDLKNTLINNYDNFNYYDFVVQAANEYYQIIAENAIEHYRKLGFFKKFKYNYLRKQK